MHYERARDRLYRFLRWSEHYTKTDMVYLASGGFWLTVGQGVAALSAFVLSIVFANYLSPTTYGMYKYVLSLAGIAAIPTLGGMAIAVQRAIARGEDAAAQMALKTKLWGGTLTALGAGIAAAWYFVHGNTELGTALVIVAIGVPFMEAYSIYDAVFQGKGMFKTTAFAFIFSSVVATTALIGSVFLFGNNLVAILCAYFGAWVLARWLMWKTQATRTLSNTEEETPGGTALYGIRLSAISIVSTIAGHIDKIILFQFLGPVQLAIYTFAIAMPEQFKAIIKALTPLALSRFSRRSAEEVQSDIHRKSLITILVTVPVIIVYVLLAPYIFHFLFPAYLDSILYSQVFMLSALIVAPLYSAALQSQRAEKLIATTDITVNIAGIALLLILIPLYGIWGAIAARIVTRLVALIALGSAVRRLS